MTITPLPDVSHGSYIDIITRFENSGMEAPEVVLDEAILEEEGNRLRSMRANSTEMSKARCCFRKQTITHVFLSGN